MPPITPAAVQAKLDSSRNELLDLTFRNPLLNYRPLKARGVEVVEAKPEIIYPLLVGSGRKMSFAHVPPRGALVEDEGGVAGNIAAATTIDVEATDSTQGEAAYGIFDEYFRKLDGDAAGEGVWAESTPHIGNVSPALEQEREDEGASEVDQIAITEAPVEDPSSSKTRRDAAAAAVLQTTYSQAELHRRLLTTMLTARTFVEEQGVNTLFLALGMMTWREADSGIATTQAEATAGGTATHRSPLLLIPVELERTSASDRFTLRWTEEEVIGNVSLATYLKQNFGLELPEVPEPEDLDVARYLGQVELLVGGKSGWQVESSAVALAFFSFNKYLMYRELEDAAWPKGQGPSSHPILNALLGGGFREPAERFGESDNLDRVLSPSDTKTVVEADGSQVLAIEDVKQGRNLVIQGPPGTGKSQSITNIIAEALGQNKTVLFVSEKMAALEVVKRRLDSVGLGDACLELHSNKTNKKAVLNELKRTLALGKPVASATASDDLALLIADRDRLNAYCDDVNAPIGASGWTPHNLYGEWLRLQTAYRDVEVPRLELPAVAHTAWTSLDYRQRVQAVSELQAQVASMGAPPSLHPFWGSARTTYVSTDADDFRRIFADAQSATTALRAAAERLSAELSLPAPTTAAEAEALAAATERALAAPDHGGMQFSSGQWLARRADLAQLIALGAHLTELKGRYDAVLAPEAWDTDVREMRQAVAEHGAKWFKFLLGDWRTSQKSMRLLCQSTPPHDAAVQIELLDAILDYRRTKASFVEQGALGAMLFGAQWQAERSDWPVLTQLLQWIVGVHEEVGDGKLPTAFIDFLSGGANLKALAPDVAAVQSAVGVYHSQVQRAVELLQFYEEIRFGGGHHLADKPLSEQEALFGQWVAGVGRLQQIAGFNHLAAQCRALDLSGVADVAATTERGGDLLVPAFQRAYCQALLRQVFTLNPALANFNGGVHWQTAAQFRALDKRLLENNRIHLASRHWEAVAHLVGRIGGSGTEGQLRVLTREFEKKSRHIPIRGLMEKAGHAIQAIKPVFMMSPLSVATFLAPGSLKFDLVVFDEASQVKPVDALGALVRGGQSVVVGDSKQLPPTSFFDSLAQSDGVEADSDNETADMESILGLFAGQGAPQRMLRWHYRSRHESLIAVSNQEFYDNKLVIFPSPDAARERLGLMYRYLPDTVYDRGVSGTNRAEAKAVAEAALAHARLQLPKPRTEWQTLGVAAFSMGQMQTIQDQLEILRRLNPDAEAFFNAAPHNEPFFVKNLENVQGDERDVIFISVGYGRDRDGQVSMNFGPLNKQGGERRLNVLISRARLRCEVFTNLLPENIDLSRTSARGVESFKTFLAYARSTESALANSAAVQEPATAFEREVLSVLQASGCQVVPQVGCAGYFIDLAVVDPNRSGRYLLGIECDGPNYQSARSARDRDRLRADVLGAMGWRLHRIWSTDWIHRYDDEVAKLKAAIEAAIVVQAAFDEADAAAPVIDTVANPGDTIGTLDIQPPVDSAVQRTQMEESKAPAPVAVVVPSYTVAALPAARHIDINNYAQQGTVAELVTAVVMAESPVHAQEVSRRVAGALGVQRVTESFHAKVSAAAATAERAGRIRKQGAFYWNPEVQMPLLRNRASLDGRFRNLDLIAPEEIALAVRQAVTESYGLPLDDVARAACRILGFERVTTDMKVRVDAIVQEMMAGHVLAVAGATVTLA